MLPYEDFIENEDDLVSDLEEDEEADYNIKTFYLDATNNTLGGMVDGITALKQNIWLMLNTEADQHIIYPYTYGLNTLDLIGKPIYYVAAILPERIKETLLTDDRVTDVTDFEFGQEKNKLYVKFIVHTIFNEDIIEETVVNF